MPCDVLLNNMTKNLFGAQIRMREKQHQKTCPEKESKLLQALLNQVADLRNELKSQKKSVTSIKNMTNNVHINVVMPKDFMQGETMEHITNKFLFECLKAKNIPLLLETVHFHPDHPENTNVRVKNVKMNIMEIVDDSEWKPKQKDYVLCHMVNHGYRILSAFYKEHKDKIECKLDDEELEELFCWFEQMNKEDKCLLKDLKSDLFYMVMGKKTLLMQREQSRNLLTLVA